MAEGMLGRHGDHLHVLAAEPLRHLPGPWHGIVKSLSESLGSAYILTSPSLPLASGITAGPLWHRDLEAGEAGTVDGEREGVQSGGCSLQPKAQEGHTDPQGDIVGCHRCLLQSRITQRPFAGT